MRVFGGLVVFLQGTLRYRVRSFTIVNNMGLARKFIWVFLHHIMEASINFLTNPTFHNQG